MLIVIVIVVVVTIIIVIIPLSTLSVHVSIYQYRSPFNGRPPVLFSAG
jgi:hypothetical protein